MEPAADDKAGLTAGKLVITNGRGGGTKGGVTLGVVVGGQAALAGVGAVIGTCHARGLPWS